jgi:hypothetical protein
VGAMVHISAILCPPGGYVVLCTSGALCSVSQHDKGKVGHVHAVKACGE